MKKLIKALATGSFVAILVGCANINSGNVAGNVKPLPYGTNEISKVITEKTMAYDAQGRVVSDRMETTKSGLAVNEGIQHGRLDAAKSIEESRAGGSSSGVIDRTLTSNSSSHNWGPQPTGGIPYRYYLNE